MHPSRTRRSQLFALCFVCLSVASRAAAPLLFHASFDQGLDADVSVGDGAGLFNGHAYSYDFTKSAESAKDPLLKFAPGIRGKGLLTGVNGQVVYYQAAKHIQSSAWTVTFWVKGLEGQDFLDSAKTHQQLFEMQGGGWTRFYKYSNQTKPMFLITKPGPAKKKVTQVMHVPRFDTSSWHFIALVYDGSKGVSIYVDGILAGADGGLVPIPSPQWFRLGQSFGGDPEPNRVMDELRVYGGALTAGEVAHRHLLEGAFETGSHVRIHRTRKPVSIDGELDPVEWEHASIVTGFLDSRAMSAAEPQTTVRMTYDDENLYLGFHSAMSAEAINMPEMRLQHGMLKRTRTEHDVDVEADDAFRLELVPPEGTLYRLTANGLNTQYEYSISPEGHIALKWDPRWRTASQVSMAGWSMEMALPFADLGLKGPPGAGQSWQLQLTRYWRQLKEQVDVWSRAEGAKKGTGTGMGRLVFGGKQGVAVRIRSLEGVASGMLELDAELRNLSAKETSVDFRVVAGQTELVSKTIPVAAEAVEKVRASSDLTQLKANVLTISATQSDGTLLWHQNIPFFVPEALELGLKHYPTERRLALSWRLRKAGHTPADLHADIAVLGAKGETVLHRHRVSPLPALEGGVDLDVGSVPAGAHRVQITIRTGKGDVLVSKATDWTKAELPAWVGNQLGISEDVPPPWTPLEANGDRIAMWGRTYQYDGALFPVQIVNQGSPILARPMVLSCETGTGKGISSEGPATVQWDEKRETRVASTRRQALADLAVCSQSYVEFDGMAWVELEVRPAGADPVKLEELSLRIPLKPEMAQLINAYDYSLRKTGRLPEKGFESSMGPRWVGCHDGGIQVFAESSDSWLVEDKRRELRILPEGDTVVLSLHLVDRSVLVKEPLRFAFGFMVTPVKRTVPAMRDTLAMSARRSEAVQGTGVAGGYLREATKQHPELRVFHIWQQGWWHTEPGYRGNPDHTGFYPLPKADLPSTYGTIKTTYGLDIYSAPYCRLQETWAASPEFAVFGDEWASNVNKTFVPNRSAPRAHWKSQVCQNAKSFQDFTLYGLNQLFEKTQARALYFDVSKPHACNNSHHGCGTGGDGAQPAYSTNFLGTRQLLRRIYTLLKQKHPDGLIFFHMSGQVIMPCWSFTDALVDGENTYSLLDRKDNRGYEKVLTLDQFAAEYAAQNNFGPWSVMLPQFSRSGAIRADEWADLGYQHAEYLLGQIFLHNSHLWFPAYIAAEPTVALHSAFDANGLTAKHAFVGYWKQTAQKLPNKVVASFYVAPDQKRAFMLVMNVNETDVTLDLAPSAEALGMAGLASGRQLYPNADILYAKGRMPNATIPANNFRLYLLSDQ